MKHAALNFPDVENVGLIDSVFRGSLGIAILLSVLLIPTISSTQLVTLTLLVIYAGLTAFISWDPIYALLMKRKQRPQPVKPVPPGDVEPGGDEMPFRKAA